MGELDVSKLLPEVCFYSFSSFEWLAVPFLTCLKDVKIGAITLTWIMWFDDNDIAFPNVLSSCVCVSFAQLRVFT